MTESVTRRRFLVSSVLATTSASLFSLPDAVQAKTYHGSQPLPSGTPANPEAVAGTNYLFFTGDEPAFVEAAVARLIPADALGSGALEAGCALFIDRQLAGDYGRANHWYMQGPWPEGGAQQGRQTRMSPAETYRAGIRAVNDYCRGRFSDKTFKELAPGDQDQLLAALEKGEPELEGVKAKGFFAMLLQNTIEGFFSDPLYGGNRDMVGWKLIGFPGARYDHRDVVNRHGEKYSLPPVGILGRKAWS
jgi:gluconate 2-dehydrogenase gamma chain